MAEKTCPHCGKTIGDLVLIPKWMTVPAAANPWAHNWEWPTTAGAALPTYTIVVDYSFGLVLPDTAK